MKQRYLLPVFFLLCLLTSCNSQLNKEYSSVKPHEEQYEVDLYSDALTVENYLGLKNAILSFVETGTEYGVIRIYSYDGDVVSDLANTVYEVSHIDPLGAYAVNYMTYDYAHIVSYYEIYIYITFRVNIADIDGIIYCRDGDSITNAMEDLLLQHKPKLTMRLPNYQEFDPEVTLHSIFLSHPEIAIGEPQYSISLYPDSGIQRIMEIFVSYPVDIVTTQTRQAALAEKVTTFAADIPEYWSAFKTLEYIYQWFPANLTLMNDDSALFTSAYTALVNQYGNSQGIALSVQMLCNTFGIPCYTVEGSYHSTTWYWNIVYADDTWFHMDAANAVSHQQSELQPVYDNRMSEYTWDRTIYPNCPSPTNASSKNSTQEIDLYSN